MPAIPWEWAWPIGSERLTGRCRTRIQSWTGKLILQVEVERQRIHHLTGENGIKDTCWRDASHGDAANGLAFKPPA